MYSVLDLSVYIIRKVNECGMKINSRQLNNILYYSQGYYSALFEIELFKETFLPWPLGPMVKEVYEEYSLFSSYEIIEFKEPIELDQETEAVILYVLYKKINIEPYELSEEIKKEDPYRLVHSIYGERVAIPNKIIESYFKERINEL